MLTIGQRASLSMQLQRTIFTQFNNCSNPSTYSTFTRSSTSIGRTIITGTRSGPQLQNQVRQQMKKLFQYQQHRRFSQQKIMLAEKVKSEVINKAKDEKKAASLWQKVKHEVNHYWAGTKLLVQESRISFRLLWRMSRGIQLTRREYNQVHCLF
jgi:hypothetical protein